MAMRKMGLARIAVMAVLTGLLLSGGQGLAQISNARDEGTAKRGYGDPLPEKQRDGSGPGGQTLTLVEAAQSGGVAEARGAFLLGESVNSRDPRGKPALLIAAHAGNISVLRFLLEKEANPNLFEKATGKTALIAAAERGDSAMLRILLDYKADPDHQDRQGETALIKAARIGDLQSVSVLLGAGLNVNLTDYAGHTALWHAMEARNTKIVQLIQTAGGS